MRIWRKAAHKIQETEVAKGVLGKARRVEHWSKELRVHNKAQVQLVSAAFCVIMDVILLRPYVYLMFKWMNCNVGQDNIMLEVIARM